MTLLDSLRKRVEFLSYVTSELKLSNVECIWDRAETCAHHPKYREAFDVVTARALAKTRVLGSIFTYMYLVKLISRLKTPISSVIFCL